jgi:Taurine catabolism dioxygenase TauD, TfdA family
MSVTDGHGDAKHTQGPVEPFRDRSVWERADFPQARAWVRPLAQPQLAEIDAAIGAARRAGLAFHQIRREDFLLPLTAPLLRACADDLEFGRGFSVIGGFPVERYSYDDNLIAYAGMSAHIGRIVDQSYAGAMVVDVKNKGLEYSAATRGYNTSAELLFHTDGACLTGLFCLGTAEAGGLSVLASSGAVHNAVLAERPDLHAVLRDGFFHHRRGEHGPGEPPVSAQPVPVFAYHDGLMHCTYDRNQSLWAREAGVVLSDLQMQALDYMDAVVARPELQLFMDLRLGDIQYVNNFTVLHARTSYSDGPGRHRHLLRLWLDAIGQRWRGPTMRDLYVRRVGEAA